MRLINASAKNFGSYKELEIDYVSQGLTLIQGPTGSGKSTTADLACWALFGVTAKGGSVDNIKTWNQDEATYARILVEVNGTSYWVTRVRGKQGQNDLWYSDNVTQVKRGKDLNETQKQINQLLGVDSDLYLTSAYFCEFSPTSTFFLAKAKERRELFEKIANLDLSIKLAEAASANKKESKAMLQVLQTDLAKLEGKLNSLNETLALTRDYIFNFEETKKGTLIELKVREKNFEKEKQSRLDALETKRNNWEKEHLNTIDHKVRDYELLDLAIKPQEWFLSKVQYLKNKLAEANKCPTCGNKLESSDLRDEVSALEKKAYKNEQNLEKQVVLKLQLERLQSEENPYTSLIEEAKESANTYSTQIEEEAKKVNPFKAQLFTINTQIEKLGVSIKLSKEAISELESKISYLEILYDLSFKLRALLLQNSVREIQDLTNKYLDQYFDAEIKVEFSMASKDSLDITIQKSGNECDYSQLSKGQRGLLKLCFTVAVMKVSANKASLHFSNLFFDESLDGLDTELKVKAFSLFESLSSEHESIFLIDHCTEFKSMFNKQYNVELIGDYSTIKESDHVA